MGPFLIYNGMKKLLLIFLLSIFSLNVNAQQYRPNLYKPNKRLVLKEDGWFTISLGTTIMASSYFIHFNYDTNGVKEEVRVGGLTFATTIGVGLHIISWKLEDQHRSRPKF